MPLKFILSVSFKKIYILVREKNFNGQGYGV